MAGDRHLRRITVATTSSDKALGLLSAGGLRVPCALGRTGVRRRKREGDGATPAGRHGLLTVFYRADRLPQPVTGLPTRPLRPDDGWCDDPGDRRYNRLVRLPLAGRHERLWRPDGLYDILVVLDYNLARPEPGAGSAIFLHIASPGLAPTEGCVRHHLAGDAPAPRPRRPRHLSRHRLRVSRARPGSRCRSAPRWRRARSPSRSRRSCPSTIATVRCARQSS